MLKDIYDPLTEYVNVFRNRFKEVTQTTFAELAEEAKVDVEANRETCRQLYEVEALSASVKSNISWWAFLRGLLWCLVVLGVLLAFFKYDSWSGLVIVLIALTVVIMQILLFMRVHPHLKALKAEWESLESKAAGIKDEAWKQMAPLNRLYDWDVLTRMISATVPKLEFDPYFTTQRLADLQRTYGWDGSFNEERSVIYSHSGLINGNPFVICRTRKMEMGIKTYYGQKTIYWSRRERGADGKYHTVQHSETLHASVDAPYPEYYEKTRIIYGNTAAPDLIFYRKQNDLAGKEGSLAFKWRRHQLRNKARDLSNADFAMMTNEEFEVAFNTSNRNNNQQYALLFTPLAQESMMKLLTDKEVGYGDDFDFDKNKMINTIVPNHMQELDLDMNPNRYCHFDYDKAKEGFYKLNADYFRAIYFSMAPLLCVPMYQQIRSHEDIYGRDMQQHSAFWEHEALANFWGQDNFKHPECVTDCILKTEQQRQDDDSSVIQVYAYGYRSEVRLTYVDKYGGDGRYHKVPVYWDEYLPVCGNGRILMQEDNDEDVDIISQKQRLEHIETVLTMTDSEVYRRHIASKI